MKINYQNTTDSLIFSETTTLTNTPHLHKEFEMIYSINGEVTATIEKDVYLLKPGEILIVFPNQVHKYKITKPGKFYFINFSTDILYGINSQIYNQIPIDNIYQVKKGSKVEYMLTFFNEINSRYINTAVCGSLNIIFSLILSEVELRPETHSVNDIIKNILNYCLKNYRTNISLQVLSSELHINKYYISNIFNKNLQISFNDYINSLRVTKACTELTETDKKISDIAHDVGFGSIRSFNYVFKSQIKCTPRDYRNHRKSNQ